MSYEPWPGYETFLIDYPGRIENLRPELFEALAKVYKPVGRRRGSGTLFAAIILSQVSDVTLARALQAEDRGPRLSIDPEDDGRLPIDPDE
jgi:hypothetical protein